MTPVKLLAAAALVVLVALGATTGAAAQADDDNVVLTIGLTQDLDTPNVTAGELVSSYELYNLQYASPTDLAAADFATEPGLAESWEASDDGRTYTYTLREGLQWSDDTPLTAEDIAYTINRARDEDWLNYSSTVANLEAEAPDERTLVVASKVNDPRLPGLPLYIVPKHVWEEVPADGVGTYAALDGVGSGPFTLSEWKKGQFWRMEANPNFWRGQVAIDEVVFRVFRNADAMVAALRRGEIDAAHNVPASSFPDLETEEGIVAVAGEQGGFDYLVLNAYDNAPERDTDVFDAPHPALTDLAFRQAIAHAIDKETLVERVLNGIATPGTTMSPSPNPSWIPELTEEETYEFDLEKANQILDDAGYTDSNGNGIREYEGEDIVLRYAIRSESEYSKPYAEFITGWLEQIGIDTTLSTYDDGQLIEVAGKGDFDLYVWGWTPFVDPDPMLSYFKCDQVSVDASDFSNYYNDTGLCDSEYDELYGQQNQELDLDARQEIVHEMLTRFYTAASYIVLATSPDLQAHRTDRFTGWVKQPADTGPVLFSNSSPSYWNLTPTGESSEGDGLSTGGIVAIAIAGALGLALVAWFFMRRRTAEERE
ncbi:MAG TPA: ABC transporter substrate-binding protein [Gaiellaceae bacterium]|nr:ABC transporter substrate-binding protein [Gaiellaceae bacterium]